MKDYISSENTKNINNNINNIISQFETNICTLHNKEFSLYCKTCLTDICCFCQNNHINHDLIKYEIILPKNEEIKLLLDSIKKYNDDYNNLLIEIYSWKKEIDKIIIFYQEQLKNNIILNNNINFIYNFIYYKMNYISILKFREIYSSIIEPQKNQNNSQILNYMTKGYELNERFCKENNMGLFDYNNYQLMKFCLDKIIDKNNKYDFVNNSYNIIRLIWDTYNDIKKGKKKYNKYNNIYNNRMYSKNNINSLSEGNLLKRNIFLNDNINNKLINFKNSNERNISEIYIDLSNFNKINNIKNKELINHQSITPNIGNIFLEQNKEINMNKNLMLNNYNNNDNNNLCKKYNFQTYVEKHNSTKANNSFFSEKILYKKKKSNSNNKWSNNKRSNSLNIDNQNESNSIMEKSNIKEIIINKFIPKIKDHNKKYLDKDKKGKNYIHKKFDSLNANPINYMNYNKDNSLIFVKSGNKNEKNEFFEQNDNSILSSQNKLNNTFSQFDNRHKKLNLFCSNINNMTPLNRNLLNLKQYQQIMQIKEKKYNTINDDSSILKLKDLYNFPIIKTLNNKKYKIKPNIPLCIGIEINNNDCKLGIINQNEQNSNQIELFCFKNNSYTIPTIISFNEKSNEVEIGYEAYDSLLVNPSRTIFNIMKIFGKNNNEISFNQNLYPYKIYTNENLSSSPYIKIDYNNKKEKKFFFEDLFIIYIQKLFEIFFKEVEIENNDKENEKNIIQLILVISVPDNFNYFQRKIIEKLFQTEIFLQFSDINNYNIDIKQDNVSTTSSKLSTSLSYNSTNKRKKKLYGRYQIILKDIKIESCSSIANLCLKTINSNNQNILIININGNSINLSLSSIYQERNNENNEFKNIYQIKREIYIEKGEEDFINNYITKKLNINSNNNIENKNNINIIEICKLRKICYEMIKNINEHNEDILSEKDDYKNEFIKSLIHIFNEIIFNIKKILKKEKVNENNITNILLIGSLSKTNIFIQMLKELFKFNKDIINQLTKREKNNNYNDEIYDDYLIAAGAAIQSYNLENINSNYLLMDICPNSFGIESLNGCMEFIIEKGTKIPIINQKFIKIKKYNDNIKNANFLEINIYEGENKEVVKNKLISNANIDKKNFKNEKIGNNYIELLIQFEIDKYYNLRVYVLEPKTLKRRFECLINIDIIKR